MRDYITERVILEAKYIAQTGATVRKAAEVFRLGKSTIHKDMVERLKHIDKELYELVQKVLQTNLSERHLRGGMATKRKYLSRKKT